MIVVTGGAGFIGSNIVAKLNDLGHDNIIIVDHLGTSDKWKNLNGLKFTDIFNKDKFYDLMMDENVPFNIDTVFHMGACSSTTEKDADYLLQNNYKYSLELVKYCLPRRAHFIYASSAATYGNGSAGYDDEKDISSLRPLNMYGYSKQMFDLWLRKMKISSKVVGLKFFNVYGTNEYHKDDMRSVVHKAYEQILKTGKVKLFKSYNKNYNDGEQKRDFVYVKDVVELSTYFFQNRDKYGLFNVGTGKARTWNDLVSAVFNAMGKPINIEYIEMPEYLRKKYQYFTEAKMDAVKKIGFSNSFTSLEDGVDDYVKNYLMKEEPYLKW